MSLTSQQSWDLIVIGGGPAGATAALEAASGGLRVLLLDEGRAAGGQAYRAPVFGDASGPDAAAGKELRARLAASPVACRFETRVWHVERGVRVATIGPEGPATHDAPRLVVATGAVERHRPFPGWTLPGVVSLAGATNLLKSEKVLPGRRVAVAGSGPLLYLVAAGILAAGGELAVVVDARARGEWLGEGASLLGRPDLAIRGASWIASIRRAGVPHLYGHALCAIEGADAVEAVGVSRLGRPGGQAISAGRFACDAVCTGFGLLPQSDIARLLGARHAFDPVTQCWLPLVDGGGATDVRGLYVCGDGAGVLGAAAAGVQGALAGLAVVRAEKGRLTPELEKREARFRRAIRRSRRFGNAMSRLATPPPEVVDLATADTVVCRCEGITRADLERGIAAGADTVNALKATTRCGMGPCGGRVCEDMIASLIAARTGRSREAVGQSTARPPLRPIPIGDVVGDFNYLDLPMPEPAPE